MSSAEILCLNIFVFQEYVEEELLGDVTDGEKCGQAKPLGSKYPHVFRSLQQGQLWPTRLPVRGYFKPCFALTH